MDFDSALDRARRIVDVTCISHVRAFPPRRVLSTSRAALPEILKRSGRAFLLEGCGQADYGGRLDPPSVSAWTRRSPSLHHASKHAGNPARRKAQAGLRSHRKPPDRGHGGTMGEAKVEGTAEPSRVRPGETPVTRKQRPVSPDQGSRAI